ncbi:hypothetical protein Tco_1018365 [Tanacetum coccineum]|uniref:Uncharacterized protein n=1 Tax=Tanacetum coccineum TaxID=301880 RepID=A0ABQ5FVL0_9ASTR
MQVFCCHDIHAEGMTLSDFSKLVVRLVLKTGTTSWPLKDLLYNLFPGQGYMVEHAGSSSRFNSKGNKKDKRKNDKKGKGKSEYLAPKAGIVKQKFQGTCYNTVDNSVSVLLIASLP